MPVRKLYVVWKGLQPGIYETWKECEAQIKGVDGAVYMGFTDREDAVRAFRSDYRDYIGKKAKKKNATVGAAGSPVRESISVDAACSGNPGELEYRGVDTATGRQIFHQGPFPLGTVNIGEFLAVVHALALLKKHGSKLPVYSDSRTAIKWVKDKAIKTNLPRVKETEELFALVDRALSWLRSNVYENALLKWDTEHWGEIPADFGRK